MIAILGLFLSAVGVTFWHWSENRGSVSLGSIEDERRQPVGAVGRWLGPVLTILGGVLTLLGVGLR